MLAGSADPGYTSGSLQASPRVMEELIEKAAVLLEALPYIRRFHGRTFVIKYGGSAMIDAALQDSFVQDVLLLKYVGIHVVIVHGGGPQIDALLRELGITPKKVEGLRVTDDRTMEVVEMVLGGKINKSIVSLLGRHGGRAVGLSGIDDGLLLAEKLPPVQTKLGTVDTGRVGDIREVRPAVLTALLAAGFTPVVAPLAVDREGRSLNVNADTAAGEIAAALKAEKFMLMTDTAGVCDRDGKLIQSLSSSDIATLRENETITGGMIPKVECALAALSGGVGKVHVIDGRVRHAILLEIFTDRGVGTEIVR
ncbi:MAG TPA: acetylglutamate kinase [Polyangiales bacterium]|nr:acetylglutamate kinase [Polyangiales bacterium]